MPEKRKEQRNNFQSFGPHGRRGPGGPGGRFGEVEHAKNRRGTILRLLGVFAADKSLIACMALTVVLGTLCGIIAPSLQSQAVDILAGTRQGIFARTLTLMILSYLIYTLSQFFRDFLGAHLSLRLVRRLRTQLFSKLVDMPVRYLDTHSHGDVMSRMTNDVESISSTISQALPSLFSGLLMILGTVSVMFWYCWQLTLLSCGTVFLTMAATKALGGKVRKFSRERQALLGQLNGNVEEIVSGYRTVVAYNHQEASVETFMYVSDNLTRAGIRVGSLGGIFGPIMNAVGNLSFVVVAAFGGYYASRGLISVGVISAFIVYARQFSRPINQLANIYNQIQSALAGAERVFTVLDEANEDMSGEAPAAAQQAEVLFDHVNFSYQAGRPVLKDFCLRVPAGKRIALVGSTGSGKTTVVNLLMRYYDLDSGSITINGQNIADMARGSLRQRVAIVLQDTVLFTDTVRSNLKYAAETASDEEMLSAAEQSRCLGFIQAMPEGFDTVLSGAGANLSQGQRQLLSIARAFLADPDILILDEATSSVDTRTEKAIQAAMQRIMRERTSIVIAHRLSTIRDSDLIVVLDDGRIAESGTHEQLLAQRGKYYTLYTTQYAGFAT